MRIVLAEDEQLLNDALTEVLQNMGHLVYSFTDGLTAKDFIVENTGVIDLIITDNNMPKMKGQELGEFLLRIESKIPRVCFSSDVLDHDFKREYFNNCFKKPWNQMLFEYVKGLSEKGELRNG